MSVLSLLLKHVAPPLHLFLGWLRGFIQSKPGAAVDDPWPAGRVEGSARTALPLHVSVVIQ